MKKKGWNKRVFVAILVIVMAAACFGCGVPFAGRAGDDVQRRDVCVRPV